MGKFIKIIDTRYNKGIIKKYKPLNEKSIILYFNHSRYKIESETLIFKTKRERDNMINELDSHYLSD